MSNGAICFIWLLCIYKIKWHQKVTKGDRVVLLVKEEEKSRGGM